MQTKHLKKAGIFTLIFVSTFVIAWEFYLRSLGFPVSFNDDEALWAHHRDMVYEPSDLSTVFIGSSRIKFDLDIPEWKKITGEDAVQLAMVGTSPRLLLADLADDKNFKGKVVIDVTEGLFFNRNTKRFDASAVEGIDYYKKITPAQRFSFYVNYVLESGFVFLDKKKFSLNQYLDELPIPNRKGVFKFPLFPKHFGLTHYNRQSFMDEIFLNDTSLQRIQKNNWTILGAADKTHGIPGDSLITVFKEIKTGVDKIKARGGEVIFVRTPSSGVYIETEQVAYPRKEYWDGLLAYTGCKGIHFEDYPEIAHFICPEWSHLNSADAVIYTKTFIRILEQEKGWKFPNTSKTQ